LIGTSSNTFLGALQLAPDGKIYLAESNENVLGAINNPELPGILCNYVDTALLLSGGLAMLGLPNFISSNFINTSIFENKPQTQITVFPSPFNSQIIIKLNNQKINHVLFSIKNTLGQTVFKKEENNQIQPYTEIIDLNFLEDGIYLINITVDKEQTIKKIIKQ
jgi:hypothetical protein